MSDPAIQPSGPVAVRHRDAGLTLPELLITVTVLGMLATVLSGAVAMTLRENDNTEGRLNIARSEQSIGYYLPNDLASAASSGDTDPHASPCPSACPPGVDLAGSNALLLTWTKQTRASGGPTEETRVSYRYSEADTGHRFQIDRVACSRPDSVAPWLCTARTVLDQLDGPAGFTPGDPVPTYLFVVSDPLAPDASGSEIALGTERKNANRVDITVDGGGDAPGSGGGTDNVDVTVGGTDRATITPESTWNAPTLNAVCDAGYYCPVAP